MLEVRAAPGGGIAGLMFGAAWFWLGDDGEESGSKRLGSRDPAWDLAGAAYLSEQTFGLSRSITEPEPFRSLVVSFRTKPAEVSSTRTPDGAQLDAAREIAVEMVSGAIASVMGESFEPNVSVGRISMLDDLAAALASGPSSALSFSFSSGGGFTYVPQPNWVGTDQFTYELSNSAGNSQADVEIMLSNYAPEVYDDPPGVEFYPVTTGEAVILAPGGVLPPSLPSVPYTVEWGSLRDNDFDPDADEFSLSVETAPAHGTLTYFDWDIGSDGEGDGGFIYTATLGYAGPDTFTYRGNDGIDESEEPATVSIEVFPKVDIDTDSDNDGDVDRTLAEDLLEDVPGNGIGQVGKRIFQNTDDDNKNGKADRNDLKADYLRLDLNDKNFAEIKLDATAVDDLDGHSLWLGADSGLKLWGDEQKTLLADMPNPPDRTSGSWYIWDIGPSGVSFPGTVYAEGTDLGEKQVYWRLVEPSGGDVDSDTVEINVEDLIYPFTTQEHSNWNLRPTSDWVGLEVADAWYTDTPLVDYIVTPADKGTLATIHPDLDDPLTTGTQLTWSSADGPDSPTTESYSDGFTMEFDCSFDRSRGDGTWGYVKIDPDGDDIPREKLSFVGNSGVKFGGREVAILDVSAYVGMAGGLSAFNPAMGGYVQSDGNIETNGANEDEFLNKLMTGVRYGGDYAKMADNPDHPNDGVPDDAAEFYTTLANNEGRANAHMKIDVSDDTGAGYALDVYLDNETDACYSEMVTLASYTTLDLQTHWGSGVIFSNMDIT